MFDDNKKPKLSRRDFFKAATGVAANIALPATKGGMAIGANAVKNEIFSDAPEHIQQAFRAVSFPFGEIKMMPIYDAHSPTPADASMFWQVKMQVEAAEYIMSQAQVEQQALNELQSFFKDTDGLMAFLTAMQHEFIRKEDALLTQGLSCISRILLKAIPHMDGDARKTLCDIFFDEVENQESSIEEKYRKVLEWLGYDKSINPGQALQQFTQDLTLLDCPAYLKDNLDYSEEGKFHSRLIDTLVNKSSILHSIISNTF